MKTIHYSEIVQAVSSACKKIHYHLPADVLEALRRARAQEESLAGQQVLADILQNCQLAEAGVAALCQDTGMVVVFAEVGQEVQLVGGLLTEAIDAGVRQAYQAEPFRYSVVADPLRRENTGDNTPAVVHVRLVAGSNLRLKVMAKGFGSENMSQVRMLTPADGWEGVKRAVLDVVQQAGPNPCPPIVVGVGVGGTLDQVTVLAKEALLRPLGARHSDPYYAQKEAELLEAVNRLGIGPGGLGGRVTCLGVAIQAAPTHIAGLPVAINLQCHADRHTEVTIVGKE
ncbi:MAG: fumarate hydratase [Bacillota bacterium]|jgi:fumarate hydratase subunit alpha